MDNANRASKALETGDIQTAIVEYTNALIEHPTSPDYYTQRSIAFSRLKPPRHDLALQDAETAVLCGQKRGKRDKIQAAQQRRVVALYNLGRFADAKLVLDSMKRWRPSNSKPQEMEHNMWNSKIESKLKANPQECAVSEYPTQSLPDEGALKNFLKIQLKSDGTFNFDGEDVSTEDAKPAQPDQTSSSVATPSETTAPKPPAQKLRHEWYQNNQNVIITIYAKGVPKDKADVDIEPDSVSVSFPQPSDPTSTYTFSLDPLFALIDPKNSKCQVMSTKIELTLAKALPGQKWANIEGTSPLKVTDTPAQSHDTAMAALMSTMQQQSTTAATAPSYPSSSRHGPKNWDKLADELTAKKPKSKAKKTEGAEKTGSDVEDADDGYESDMGGDAVDSFFKTLYKDSDPDTRRAMMKSFQESNGTALSTNWAEVSRGKVEEVKSKHDD